MCFRIFINGEPCQDMEPVQAHITDLEKQVDKQAAEIADLEACIEDARSLTVDYDRNDTAEGLKMLIDQVDELLSTHKPMVTGEPK